MRQMKQWILAAILTLCGAMTAWAQTSYDYFYRSWDADKKEVKTETGAKGWRKGVRNLCALYAFRMIFSPNPVRRDSCLMLAPQSFAACRMILRCSFVYSCRSVGDLRP